MKPISYFSGILLATISFCFSFTTQTIQAQPANNLPCDAIGLECGVGTTTSSASATNSGVENPACAYGSYQDVFYSFTALPGYSYSITVNGLDYDAVLMLYTGPCTALETFDCIDAGLDNNIAETLEFEHGAEEAPQTFYIRTYDYNAGGGGFSLMINCTAPNDSPCDALLIDCNTTVLGSSGGATDSETGSFSCSSSANINDLFYKFNVEPNFNYTITVNGDNFDGVLSLYSGNCMGFTEISCADGNFSSGVAETIIYEGNSSQTIYIRTTDWFSEGGDFSLSVECTSANQTPCNALSISCGQTLSGSTQGGSESGIEIPTCGSGTPTDVFYNFEAFPGIEYLITVNGDSYDGILAAYSGPCEGPYVELGCADEGIGSGIQEEISLVVDEPTTILIRTYDWFTSGDDFSISLDCDVSNSDICDAEPISCGETLYGSTSGAIFTGILNPGCASSANNPDVFFTFEAQAGTEYTIAVNGDNFDAILAAYDGTCDGNVLEIACADEGTSPGIEETITFSREENSTIYIRVYDWDNYGEFEISLNCAAYNDLPCNAVELDCGVLHQGTTEGATATLINDGSVCGVSDNPGVFYKYHLDTGYSWAITVVGSANFDPSISGYLVSSACDDESGFNYAVCATSIIGDGSTEYSSGGIGGYNDVVYYFEIYDRLGREGEFEIIISCEPEFDCPEILSDFGFPCNDGDPNTINDMYVEGCICQGDPVPANDLCSNAQEIIVNQPGECPANQVIGNTLGASDETGDYSCDTGDFAWADVFYTFNSGPYNSVLIETQLITQTDIVVNVSQLCGGESIACNIDGLSGPVSVTPNTDYIVRTGPNLSFGDVGTFSICVSGLYDCPALSLNIGDACNDGNPGTENDMVNASCNCVGSVIYDCPALSLNIGDACNDGNPGTENDMVNESCNCVGSVIYDCPALSANIGDACDDGDASTINDVVTAACTCAGEPAGAATFSGTTDWTSGCTFRPMEIALYNAGTDVHVATISFNINSAGTFSIPMEFIGTFDVYIKIDGYLRKGFYNYAMAPGDNTLDMGALTPGDLNGDNGVNIADVSVMNIAFGSVQADDNYNLLADLNCDGGVNIVDVSALNLSFGMVGVSLP